jgi:hypothetical protein
VSQVQSFEPEIKKGGDGIRLYCAHRMLERPFGRTGIVYPACPQSFIGSWKWFHARKYKGKPSSSTPARRNKFNAFPSFMLLVKYPEKLLIDSLNIRSLISSCVSMLYPKADLIENTAISNSKMI